MSPQSGEVLHEYGLILGILEGEAWHRRIVLLETDEEQLLSSVSTMMLLYVVDGKITRKDTHSKYKIRGIKEANTPQKERAKEIRVYHIHLPRNKSR